MLKTVQLALGVLVLPAILASGCGSSETSTTTSSSASATVPPTTSSTAATQSTGATGAQNTTPAPKPAETTPKPKVKIAVSSLEAAALKRKIAELGATKVAELRRKVQAKIRAEAEPGPGFNRKVPKARLYPPEIYRPFYAECQTAGGNLASCECIVVHLELTKVEKERSVAELVALELALKQGATVAQVMAGHAVVPENAQKAATACRHA